MPFDSSWLDLIQQKYAIMRQQADAQSRALGAAANLDNQKAGLLPAQALADNNKTRAETAGLLETNKTIAPLAGAQVGLYGAQARNYNADAVYSGYQSQGLARGLKTHSASAFTDDDPYASSSTGIPGLRYGFHFSQ